MKTIIALCLIAGLAACSSFQQRQVNHSNPAQDQPSRVYSRDLAGTGPVMPVWEQ